jgi:hypothetical protein
LFFGFAEDVLQVQKHVPLAAKIFGGTYELSTLGLEGY